MSRKRHHKPLLLTDDEGRTLEQWARRPKTAQRLALRSRVVLACAEGLPNRAVAQRLHVSSNCVCKWRERFRVRRLEGLTDEPRPGAPRKATDDRIVDVITQTLEGPPARATQWTTRSPGIPARQTHDYIRHGTTSLFAALDVPRPGKSSGSVIAGIGAGVGPRAKILELLRCGRGRERVERAIAGSCRARQSIRAACAQRGTDDSAHGR